jgi:hypothetical protein
MKPTTSVKIEVVKRQTKAAARYYARRMFRAIWYPLCDASETIDHFDSRASVWLMRIGERR